MDANGMELNDGCINDAIEFIENIKSTEKLVIYEDIPVKNSSENLDPNRRALQPLSVNQSIDNEQVVINKTRGQNRSNKSVNKENSAPAGSQRTLRSSKRLKKVLTEDQNSISIHDDVFDENTKPNDLTYTVRDENNNLIGENNIDYFIGENYAEEGQESKEKEIISFLSELQSQRIHSENTNDMSPIENSRKCQVLTEKSPNLIISPIGKHPASMYDVNEFQKCKSPLFLRQSSPDKLAEDRSAEISLHVYDKNSLIRVPREPLKTLKTLIVIETKKDLGPLESPMLNMSCYDDTEYNFDNSSPFAQLTEELDENNNLICVHPKLKTFMVTSDLNEKFGLKNSIHTTASQIISKDFKVLEKNKLMDFSGHLATETYDFKQLRDIFCPKEPALSSCAVAPFNYENFTSPLLVVEQDAEKLIEKEAERVEEIKIENSRKRKLPDKTMKSKKRAGTSKNPEETEFQYALEKCYDIFTIDELSTGILCETSKSGKNIIRSKARLPLDEWKIIELRESIQLRFNMDDKDIDKAWRFLRVDINKYINKNKR